MLKVKEKSSDSKSQKGSMNGTKNGTRNGSMNGSMNQNTSTTINASAGTMNHASNGTLNGSMNGTAAAIGNESRGEPMGIKDGNKSRNNNAEKGSSSSLNNSFFPSLNLNGSPTASSSLLNATSTNSLPTLTTDSSMASQMQQSSSANGKLSPSMSASSVPSSPTSNSNRKKNLYKTELCRSTEETGECPYGSKCQFAHSLAELRVIDRHPRYKTQMCKTFWEHGTCPYGRRCCFLHAKKDAEEEQAAAASLGSTTSGSAGNNSKSLKNLSIRPQRDGDYPSSITLHSPRARTVSTQEFDSPPEKNHNNRHNGLSPILSKLEMSAIHARTNSVPLEIHTREIQSARPSLSTSFQLPFSSTNRGTSFSQHNSHWDEDLVSPSVYGRQPFSAGVEGQKSWDNIPLMKNPLSNQQSSFSASNPNDHHPWLSSSIPTDRNSSVWPHSPKQKSQKLSVNALGNGLGKLSVSTNFSTDFKSRNVGSLSAIPFRDQVGTLANTPIEKSSHFMSLHSMSSFPDSTHASTGFFPESPIANSALSSSMGARSMILTESLSTKNGFPETYGSSLRSVSGFGGLNSIVGSPLATSFGEDPFGNAFSDPPSSPSFLNHANRGQGRSRQTLRDVWSTSIPTSTSENVETTKSSVKPSPLLSETSNSSSPELSSDLQQRTAPEMKTPGLGMNTSLVSPPATPQRKS